MRIRHVRRARIAVALLLAAGAGGTANAALFWQLGVQAADISVCFVGDSLQRNPDFANLVVAYMKEFEYVAGIRFNNQDGIVCPPAVPDPADPSRDFFAGDIRIIIPDVTTVSPFGWVPGAGCPHDPNWENPDGSYNGDNDGWGSWANPPSDLGIRRSCTYNVKLGEDGDATGVPWRNHTLHEIGHALGLSHEHVRADVDPTCNAPDYGGSATSGLMTPYDRASVMHYQFLSCGINGNYGHSGLSAWDRIALHILYPENNRVSEFVGTTVIPAGQNLTLESAWQHRGALMNNVSANLLWRLDGIVVGAGPVLSTPIFNAGNYQLEFSMTDALSGIASRAYYYSTTIRVLWPADYRRLMGALNMVPFVPNVGDTDSDGVSDDLDNCTLVANGPLIPDAGASSQRDTDADGIGNVCDPDVNNDCTVNFLDLNVYRDNFFQSGDLDTDNDGDGITNFVDLNFARSAFFGPPGPSANGCN